ncbi:hypothetical protein Tco_0852184 [Tanacetum coccineum]
MMVEELVEVEKEAKVDDVMDIIVDTKENDKVKQDIMVFTKVSYYEYDESFMSFSTLCEVEGNEAMDTKLNMAYFDNYMSKELLNDLRYVRLDYGEPSIVENKDVDALLENLLKNMVIVNDASGEQVKMGKANRLKNYKVNKLTPPVSPKIKEIPKPSLTPSQPLFHQLSP